MAEQLADLKVFHTKIGQLTLENDFFEGALNKTKWNISEDLIPIYLGMDGH